MKRDSVRKIRQALQFIVISIWAAAGVMILYYLPRIVGPTDAKVADQFTRAEFITIILTAVTVILAALAIMLAIAAFWGYTQIKEEARRAAATTATRVAMERAGVVAARVAEQTAQQTADGAPDAGDAIGQAAGSGDAGST